MAVFGGLILTNNGRNLLAKAQTGKTLKFTKIVLGDGKLGSTESIVNITQLKNQVLVCNIIKKQVLQNVNATLTFHLNNQNLETGFYWREIGVIAEDLDTNKEILYCYGNAGENGEYISANGGSDILEKNVNVELIIDNVENVTAIIDDSIVYVTERQLEETITQLKSETNQSQEKLINDMSKTYTGTNITADTIAGVGRINKVYGKITETGTGDKSPSNPYKLECVGNDGTVEVISKNGTNTSSNIVVTKPLCCIEDSENNIIAQDYIDYTNKKVHRECEYITLSGNDNWSMLTEQNYNNRKYFFSNEPRIVNISKKGSFPIANIVQTPNILTDLNDKTKDYVTIASNGCLCFWTEKYSTIEAFKTALNTQPLEIVLERNAVQEIDIECSNKITQYDEQTTVYNRDGAKIEVSLTNNKAISEVNVDLDNIEEKQRQMGNYSTEEQIVGKWIDGKTLYRKVLTYNSTINTNTLFKIGEVNNVEKVISMNYVIRNSNGSQWINDYVNVNEQICPFTLIMQTTDGFLYGRSNNEAWASPFLIVTIEYTKTTD